MYKYVSYVSHQAHNLTFDGIDQLLKESRRRNTASGITGLLIFFDGIFTQYVEGPAEAVDQLYSNIFKDSRHNRVIELDTGYTEERYYGDWSMAYERLDAAQIEKIIGFKKIDKETYFKSPTQRFNHPGIDLLESFLGSIRSKKTQ